MNFTTNRSCIIAVVATVAVVVGLIVLFDLGSKMYGEVSATSVVFGMAILLGLIAVAGTWVSKENAAEQKVIEERSEVLSSLTQTFNDNVDILEKAYNAKIQESPSDAASIKNRYSKEYDRLYEEHFSTSLDKKSEWNKQAPLKIHKFWNWALGLGLLGGCAGSTFSVGLSLPPEPEINALMESRTWNAENIPMPHMDDHSLYVSNPDSILSPTAVDSINATLERLDDVLGVESAFIIVGHIENDDDAAMVRGIYNKYGVGREGRGLVVVIGYLDHTCNIAPSLGLEGDLTDAECRRLAETYLYPSMRAELPDSGMVYLADAVYALLAGKEMPQMASFVNRNDSDDGGSPMPLLLGGLLVALFGGYAGKKSSQTTPKSRVAPRMNPFYTPPTSSSSNYGGGGSGGRSRSSWGGGSSKRSGGYGGSGSWGGGGYSGKW